MNLDAIKAATWDLHQKAEQSGIIADVLAGRATREGVALFLRSLLPVYRVLDASPWGRAGVNRSASIEADLRVLSPDRELPVLPEALAYANQVRRAEQTALIAHAYVRYLGDLNGGRILNIRLASCLGDIASRLSFNEYPLLQNIRQFAKDYRAQLDHALTTVPFDAVASAARAAFESNIALSEAVKRHAEASHSGKS